MAPLDLIRHQMKKVGSDAVSITSIYVEQSNRTGDREAPFANWQHVPSKAHASHHQDLLTTVAKLRSFSLLLCLDADLADRLVEITLLRAGVCMSPSRLGTNTLGWLCGRLRSYFYSEYAGHPTAAMAGSGHLPPVLKPFQGAARDLLGALAELPVEQREALVLTEAMGFSRNQAARICSYPRHIFKIHIDGARMQLAVFLSVRALATISDDLARYASPIRHLQLGVG